MHAPSKTQHSREDHWRRHILAQQASQLGIRAYCRQHGLNGPRFFVWRKRLGLKAAAHTCQPNGLVGLVKEFLGEDPLSGHPFAFANRRGDCLKLLWWDRDGFAIWYKQLEEGRFRFAAGVDGKLAMTGLDLHLVLQGIDPAKVTPSKRYQRSA